MTTISSLSELLPVPRGRGAVAATPVLKSTFRNTRVTPWEAPSGIRA